MNFTKNPSRLVSSDKVNDTQRKNLGLGIYTPRLRDPGEAMPLTLVNATAKGIYRTGDGEAFSPYVAHSETKLKKAKP